MDLTVLLLICIVYALVMFIDFFFKSCMMLPYLDFLHHTGIAVKFFSLRIHTNAFNRFISRHSSKLPSLYKNSFRFGFYVTMVLLPVSVCLMLLSLFSSGGGGGGGGERSEGGGSVERHEMAHLEILLPGVNLPLDQIGYYVVSLLVCSVVHEAGEIFLSYFFSSDFVIIF
jgi:S2P endopeptidase